MFFRTLLERPIAQSFALIAFGAIAATFGSLAVPSGIAEEVVPLVAPTGPAGGDLRGRYPNPQIDALAVTSSKIASRAVIGGKLADGAVGARALGTITQRSQTSALIANNSSGSATASCLVGEQVLSGGNDGTLVAGFFVIASRQEGNGWRVFLQNTSGGGRFITAHAYCLAP